MLFKYTIVNLNSELCAEELKLPQGKIALFPLPKKFFETFGKNIFEVYGKVLKKYFELDLLKFDGDRIFFTPRGFKVSNIILSDFLL